MADGESMAHTEVAGSGQWLSGRLMRFVDWIRGVCGSQCSRSRSTSTFVTCRATFGTVRGLDAIRYKSSPLGERKVRLRPT